MKQFKLVVKSICSVLLMWALFSTPTAAQTITEIIDATGDGAGNMLIMPVGIAADGSGNVYVAGFGSHNAFKITPGIMITEIIDATGDGAGNTLDFPFDIAVDGSGNVYVTGALSDNAFKVTPGGVITEIIDATGDGTNPLIQPLGIAVDGSGNVYVTGIGSDNAFKITPSGVITEIIDIVNNPLTIAVDGSGNVYVTGTDNAFKVTPGGVITEIIDGTGDGTGNPLIVPSGIGVDGCGNSYVAGHVSHNAFKITSGGVITEIIDATGDGAGNMLNTSNGLAVDGCGNVYVTGQVSDNAFKITPSGVITEIIDGTGDGTGNPLDNPRVIAVDGFSNVYVTGVLSDNAFKIAPAGPCTGTISGTVSVSSNGLENVLVKLLDEFGLPVDGFDDVYTDTNGEYSFTDVPEGDYQVGIVEPLGYASDGNQKSTTVVANETSVVDFNLTEVVVVSQARSKGYWKHQFDVYVKDRGNAQESEADLQSYIVEITLRYNQHFNIFIDATDGSDDFEDWQDILSVKGNAGMEAKATAQLAALVLNIVSLKIAQYEFVTADGKTAGDVLTYVSVLIEDGDPSNDELAKDLAESVNNQQMIAAGIVPEGDILFKTGKGTNNIEVTTYELYDNYPNPFNPTTRIVYQIPERGNVSLKVYDMLGKEVTTLVEEYRDEGRFEVEFDATNLPSGIYFYRLRTGEFMDTKKMILMK